MSHSADIFGHVIRDLCSPCSKIPGQIFNSYMVVTIWLVAAKYIHLVLGRSNIVWYDVLHCMVYCHDVTNVLQWGPNINLLYSRFVFSVFQGSKPSNHATIQSLVHAIGLLPQVPAPCCVPDKLSSITLLYFDENKNVVLKNYPDMSVESCGCR